MVVIILQVPPKALHPAGSAEHVPVHCPSPAQFIWFGFYFCHSPLGGWFYWRAPETRKEGRVHDSTDGGQSILWLPNFTEGRAPREATQPGAHCCHAHLAVPWPLSWM